MSTPADPNEWDGTFAHDITANIGVNTWGLMPNTYRVVFAITVGTGGLWEITRVYRLVHPFHDWQMPFWRRIPTKGRTALKVIRATTKSRWVADPYTHGIEKDKA